MANIVWNSQKMTTGVPEVDAQHQEWIRRYNEFNDAIHQGKGIESVKRTLDFFIEYADIHFKLEEAAMAERGCPAAEANRIAHEHMRNILSGFKSYAVKYGYSMSEMIGLKIQMEQWLVKHILTIDVKLRNV
jgi:hemerythrin